MNTKIKVLVGVFLISILLNSPFAQSPMGDTSKKMKVTVENETTARGIGMKKDILEDRVRSKVLLDIDKKSAELIADGIEAMEVTKLAISAIDEENKEEAVDFIAMALGKLETVKLRSPDMISIPISRVIRTDDIDTDLESIKFVKKSIMDALNQNKFHVARKELESLISEVRIETTNIPTASYPDVLKSALVTIEKGDFKSAKSQLSSLLNTLVVTNQEISLPCMRAEVLLEESLTMQPGHTDAIENRKMLLSNAKDQVTIAYELGQIEKESSNNVVQAIQKSISSLGTAKFRQNVEDSIQMLLDTKEDYAKDNLVNL